MAKRIPTNDTWVTISPFKIKKKWYYVMGRKKYGPFATKKRATEVHLVALERKLESVRRDVEEEDSD